MAQEAEATFHIVLFGLSDSLTVELERVLRQERRVKVYSHRSVPGPHSLNLLKTLHADLVFCAAEPDRCRPLLEAMRQKQMNLPVVVVSRDAETTNWVVALEAGAQDYCAPRLSLCISAGFWRRLRKLVTPPKCRWAEPQASNLAVQLQPCRFLFRKPSRFLNSAPCPV